MNNRTIAREYLNRAMDEMAKVDQVIDEGFPSDILANRAQMIRSIDSLEVAAMMLQSSVSHFQAEYLQAMVEQIRKEGYTIQVWNDVSYESIIRDVHTEELTEPEAQEVVREAIHRAIGTKEYVEVERVEEIEKYVFVFASSDIAQAMVDSFHILDIIAIPAVPV